MLTTLLVASLVRPDAKYDDAWKYAEKFRTQAMIVMIDGKTVYENYANGGGKETAQPMASGSKSWCSVIAAAAATDKLLSYDEPVANTFIEWQSNERKSAITVRHLLNLSSGLPVGISGRNGGEREGWDTAKASMPINEPGKEFTYGPNNFNIFGSLIEAKLKGEKWEEYLNRRLLTPLGIKSFSYKGKCADGNPQLAGGGWITARDWATFGEFVRLDGNWNGKQLVDADLMRELYIPSTANPSYGMSWWLSDEDELTMMRNGTKTKGEGFRMAAGAGKQRLYIVPGLKMVAVRMGKVSAGAGGWSDKEFLNHLTKE